MAYLGPCFAPSLFISHQNFLYPNLVFSLLIKRKDYPSPSLVTQHKIPCTRLYLYINRRV